MKRFFIILALYASLFIILNACSRKDQILNPNPPTKPDTTKVPGNPIDTSRYVINVTPVVVVEAVAYDNVPATLELKSWDSANVATSRIMALKAGANSLYLDKKYLKHQLTMQKWGTTIDTLIHAIDLKNVLSIRMQTEKAARKLESETTVLITKVGEVPHNNIEYIYHSDGRLKEIFYHSKKPEVAELKHYWTDRFQYDGKQVTRIDRYSDKDTISITTEFIYDSEGKIVNMREEGFGQYKYASVAYGRETDFDVIDIDYLFANGQAMEYKMKFAGGNKVQELSRSTTGAGEGGNFVYDQYINPFFHMNRPDIYLSNLSKNNRLVQQKNFNGVIPVSIESDRIYTYDNEGYPVQMTRKFSTQHGSHLYDLRTVYHYKN